jgi:hypothetical protein
MTNVNMRPSKNYPGRTYRFYVGGNETFKFGQGITYTNFTYRLVTKDDIFNSTVIA